MLIFSATPVIRTISKGSWRSFRQTYLLRCMLFSLALTRARFFILQKAVLILSWTTKKSANTTAQEVKSQKACAGNSAGKVEKIKKSGRKAKKTDPFPGTHLPSAPILNNEKTLHSAKLAPIYEPKSATRNVGEYRKDSGPTWHVNMFSAIEDAPLKRTCNVIVPR
ncbi:hypothetical protein BIW11_00903 [Tropilaelaps mercedesae]|uniref:Uncharacterized protein n=1 Tax=Tropilaelaps mercedesae TaxID=418985 RepID=A0A1V9XML8_9ACAR|nr:hypothetical protein BIW11_00903 [Tropilaelaps mercedesae]